jgi:NAD(P)-dependent dehydrogenase (short-subunit alcohol dehydrogenase family)
MNETFGLTERPDPSLVTYTHVVYALHAASLLVGVLGAATVVGSFLLGIPSLVAVIMNYARRSDVRGTWLATVAARPWRKASGRGRVVNLASDTAWWGAPRLMAYVASKGAVMAMTHSMARAMGADGITVNAIAPGLTLVEATEYVPEARHRFYNDGRAIQRPQVPADLLAPVLFLLSEGSAYVTGQVLPVNGGFVMN